MRVLILLTLILHVSSSTLVEEFFETLEKFKPKDANNNIVGSSRQSGYDHLEENIARFREFKKSKKIVDEINKDDSIPFMAEINQFSVMTSEERKIHTGLNISQLHQADEKMVSNVQQINKNCPKAVNWNAQGAQGAVKDQGSCASCWAFAGVSSMEGAYFAVTGDLISFSDQEVLECSYEGTARPGCKGGWPADAFNWVRKRGGLSTSGDAPYIGQDGRCRKGRNAMTKARISSQVLELKHYRQGLKGAVVDGVVASGMKVTDSFYSYKSGVWKDLASCGRNAHANHALNVVGYGTTSAGRNYWRVRNSWGATWGDNGHILMCRDQKDNCRIESYGWLPKFTCTTGSCKKPQFTEYQDDGSDGNNIACKDASDVCSRYSKHCKKGMKYSEWAANRCKKTCGKCGGSDGGEICEDKESWCGGYKTHCNKNAAYYPSMVKVCKKTCNLCGSRGGGEKGGCPAGTTKCSDGVCRHVHMCGRH